MTPRIAFHVEISVDIIIGLRKAAQVYRASEWCSSEEAKNSLLNQFGAWLWLKNGAIKEINVAQFA